MRFVLNDVSADLIDGKIFQTVQTGTCEAKGFDAPCGGGGKSAWKLENSFSVTIVQALSHIANRNIQRTGLWHSRYKNWKNSRALF